jgi:hypothetical protein
MLQTAGWSSTEPLVLMMMATEELGETMTPTMTGLMSGV